MSEIFAEGSMLGMAYAAKQAGVDVKVWYGGLSADEQAQLKEEVEVLMDAFREFGKELADALAPAVNAVVKFSNDFMRSVEETGFSFIVNQSVPRDELHLVGRDGVVHKITGLKG